MRYKGYSDRLRLATAGTMEPAPSVLTPVDVPMSVMSIKAWTQRERV
jgi:hypothetical protein